MIHTQLFLCRKFASVKLVCPATEARPGGLLAQALGPHHVKPSEFSTEFNKITTPKYIVGLPLNCRLRVTQGGKFTLKVCPPTFSTLTLGADQVLGHSELWWILTYRYSRFPRPQELRNLLGTIQSFQKSPL